jgi:hypothetical protein
MGVVGAGRRVRGCCDIEIVAPSPDLLRKSSSPRWGEVTSYAAPDQPHLIVF